MSGWHRICCPIDLSATSRLAMEEAADLARLFQAELTLLYVVETSALTTEVLVSPPELFERRASDLARQLDSWTADAQRAASVAVRAEVISGPVAKAILRFAKEGAFDLVVMGTHGRTGLGHVVLGSVAEQVTRQAHCPVLVVRPTRR